MGDTISIPCEALGDPTPTIKWQKVSFPCDLFLNNVIKYIMQQSGQLDPEKKLIEDNRLVITYLSMEDGGYYECEASNEVATIVTTTLLIIEGAFICCSRGKYKFSNYIPVISPHKARNVSISTTENTANVKWLPAFDSDYAKRQDYFIWYFYCLKFL